jgi:two-component sensor histidine kinase/ligand-binding sensor protein
MAAEETISIKPSRFLWFGLVLLGFSLLRVYSFLLFHTAIEVLSIAVLAGVFILSWNTRHIQKQAYLQFFGIMSLSMAAFTLVHLLAYKGMGVFPDHDADLPTQLWIASRYVFSISMLIAPLLIGRELNPKVTIVGYAAVTLVLFVAIFADLFPASFVEGVGLTPFKRVSEYVISGILLASLWPLHRQRRSFDPGVYRLLVGATLVSVLASLSFTLYTDVYGLANMTGHLFTLLGFYLVYVALVETGLRQPYALLFRDLQRRNRELEAARDQMETLWSQASQAQVALRESEQQVRRKLDAILLPEGDLSTLELADIIDIPALQTLMDEFYTLTGFGIGIVDLQGHVLVSTGWQDICTQFHRRCPETAARCRESDLALSQGVAPGEFKVYKCRNSMWDMATPIIVGDNHVGNLFLGQFLYNDEVIDEDVFRTQARTYGFDEVAYLDAMKRVPRWSRAEVEAAMAFYATFARQLSTLSYANLRLARTLAERDELLNSLQVSLNEKTVLLREVHHRVKNNLTTIIGLVMLQQNSLSDPGTIAQFQELEGRVRSIAMVHDLLYQSQLLSRINFEAYLRNLAERLQDTFAIHDDIEVSVTAPDIAVSLDVAVPCGLIVNELITNAFKYAFPPARRANGGPPCHIAVTAEYDGTFITLSVHDNGVGMVEKPVTAVARDEPSPEITPSAATGGLGLNLVRLLGQHQLNGQITIDYNEGTTFTLRFAPGRFDR